MLQKILNQQRKVENKPKTILVGLWNPQPKYINTRHNIGADILFSYSQKNNLKIDLDNSGQFQFGKFEIMNHEILLVIPMTSMNNSGQGLKSFLIDQNIKDFNLLVIHDDIDLAFGRFRLKKGISDGGHNGIKSLDSALGTNDYWRLKMVWEGHLQVKIQQIMYCRNLIMIRPRKLSL